MRNHAKRLLNLEKKTSNAVVVVLKYRGETVEQAAAHCRSFHNAGLRVVVNKPIERPAYA